MALTGRVVVDLPDPFRVVSDVRVIELHGVLCAVAGVKVVNLPDVLCAVAGVRVVGRVVALGASVVALFVQS